jgi:hypothetical protein
MGHAQQCSANEGGYINVSLEDEKLVDANSIGDE